MILKSLKKIQNINKRKEKTIMQFNRFKIILLTLCNIICFLGNAYAKEQMISLKSSDITDGDLVAITVQYNASDTNQNLSSLGLRIHYNSHLLEYVSVDQMFAKDILVESPVPQNEITEQSDNDPGTDKIVLLSYASIDGEWPGTEWIDASENPPVNRTISLPLTLGQLIFKAKGNTTINVTRVTGDVAYEFSASGTHVLAKKWELKDIIILFEKLSNPK